MRTIHIYYDGKSHQERHFKINDKNFENWILYHAFWTVSKIEIYRPIFEIDGLNITYYYIKDFQKAEEWLNAHKET